MLLGLERALVHVHFKTLRATNSTRPWSVEWSSVRDIGTGTSLGPGGTTSCQMLCRLAADISCSNQRSSTIDESKGRWDFAEALGENNVCATHERDKAFCALWQRVGVI